MIAPDGIHAYDYDDLYRLTEVTYPGQTPDTYTYDDVGNRETLDSTSYTYDAADQTYFTYDGLGSVVDLAELTHHFTEAANAGGDLGKALDYSVRAGDRATQQRAYEGAAANYERARQMLETRRRRRAHRRRPPALGEARWATGEFREGTTTFLKAAEVAKESGLPTHLAEAAIGYQGSTAGFEAGVVDDVRINLLEDALAGLGAGNDLLRARVLASLATALAFSGSMERRQSICQEAIHIARRSDDEAVLAQVLGPATGRCGRLTTWTSGWRWRRRR